MMTMRNLAFNNMIKGTKNILLKINQIAAGRALSPCFSSPYCIVYAIQYLRVRVFPCRETLEYTPTSYSYTFPPFILLQYSLIFMFPHEKKARRKNLALLTFRILSKFLPVLVILVIAIIRVNDAI